MSTTADPQAGLTIAGRYRLGRPLGEGRTGQVFRARDESTGDKVAVKLLYRQLCTVDEEVRRFAREFELTQAVDHPNVVGMLAFGKESEGPLAGTLYLVLELLEGRGLDKALEGGAMGPERACAIGVQIARALRAAHHHDVVHRDLKPANIMLVRQRGREVVKVMDFGLARLQGDGSEELTDIGVRLGTAEYMAPEYIEEADLTVRSDMYALGILLYEMLTGQPPFVGRSMKVMQDHVDSPPPTPSKRAPGLPRWLEDLVLALLSKTPTERPSAEDVVSRIEDGLPSLDASANLERIALAHASTPVHAPPLEGVGAHSESSVPVYRDPKPLPKVPLALGMVLAGFGVIGVGGLLAILAVLLLT